MPALAILDIHDGGQRRRFEVTRWPVTVGRDLGNDLVLDDPHVAAHHATLDAEGGSLTVALAASVNGARLAGRWLDAAGARAQVGSAAPAPHVWQTDTPLVLGKTLLRYRSARAPLAPEQALTRRAGVGLTLALLGATLAVLYGELWLVSDDSAPWWRDSLPAMMLSVFVLAVWVAGWALASKLFARHTDAARHLRVLLVGVLGYSVVSSLFSVAAFAFDASLLSRYLSLIDFAAFAGLIFAHLNVIAPARKLAHGVSVGLLTLAGLAMVVVLRLNDSGSPADHPYLLDFYPPALRVAPALPLDDWLADTASLQSALDAEARDPAEAEREFAE